MEPLWRMVNIKILFTKNFTPNNHKLLNALEFKIESDRILSSASLHCAVLCCPLLCYSALCCAVLSCAVLCCAVVCCTALCCDVVWCTVLYCTVLKNRNNLIFLYFRLEQMTHYKIKFFLHNAKR